MCLLLVASSCVLHSIDLPQKDFAPPQEITQNLGRWARLRKTVHETEQESPLLFNALATLCEGIGAAGSVFLVGYGAHELMKTQDPSALIIFVYVPLPYFVIKYLCAKPLRITGGVCVKTKNWIFGSPKKADNDAAQQ